MKRLSGILLVILTTLGLTVGVTGTASAVSHSSAASQFSAAGIGWTSSGGCSDPNNSTCTSFEGIRQATIDGAITLKNASGYGLTITGGTETGHATGTYSHSPATSSTSRAPRA